MTKKNPFPGMNPFFEQQWRDAHTMLVAYIRDELQGKLPQDLVARTEEETTIVSASGTAKSRPDVQVKEPWQLKESGGVMVAPDPPMSPSEPVYIFTEEEIERWVKIEDQNGRLITVIELRSPTNKIDGSERERFNLKRRNFIAAGVNVVEIDLVRQGVCLFPRAVQEMFLRKNATYGIYIHRASFPGKHALYPVQLRERLPILSIPLRKTDQDVLLDLQPLIDQCHERGRYHLLNFEAPLDPPLSPEDESWLKALLRENGLIRQ